MSKEPKYLRREPNIGSVMTSVDKVQEPELEEQINISGTGSMNSQVNKNSTEEEKDKIRKVLPKHEEVIAK